MKKYFWTMGVVALFAIGFSASDDAENSNYSEDLVPAEMELVNVEQMHSDLSKNEMKAQKKYANKWFEIVGTLGSMDSEGEYFSLDGEGFFESIHCIIPAAQREELTDILADMNKGDRIAVKGKVTDMGEIMGYEVTVVEIYHNSSGRGEDPLVKTVRDTKAEIDSVWQEAVRESQKALQESLKEFE